MGVQIVKLLGSAVDVNVNVNPAGAYDGGTTYNTGDVVEYNGSSYIAKQGTTGNLPTDTTYWQLLAEKGDTGVTGATGAAGADGVVQSVNGISQAAVVLDPDDLDDTATTNKFTTAGDISKLAGIEALADVTDTTNVTAAGALMDSELTDITAIKALDQGVATTDSPTFAGLTLGGNILSDTDSTDDLGSSSIYWSNTYTDRLYLNSTAYLDGGTAGTLGITGDIDLSGVMPAVSSSIMRMSELGMMINLDSGFTNTTTGSGTQYSGKLNTSVLTGTTSGSTSGVVSWWNTYHQQSDAASRWQFAVRVNITDPSDQMDAWVGFFSDTTTFPTATSNHYGFRLISTSNGVDADLYATNGDGSTETSTQIATGLAQYTKFYVHAVYESGGIKYYYSTDNVNWSLVATHTTNVPGYTSLSIGTWIKNSEASNKRIEIMGLRLFEE